MPGTGRKWEGETVVKVKRWHHLEKLYTGSKDSFVQVEFDKVRQADMTATKKVVTGSNTLYINFDKLRWGTKGTSENMLSKPLRNILDSGAEKNWPLINWVMVGKDGG